MWTMWAVDKLAKNKRHKKAYSLNYEINCALTEERSYKEIQG